VILDERAVRALFPDGMVLGRRVKFGSPEGAAPWLEVIGVAARADLVFPENPDGPRWPPIYARVRHAHDRSWQVLARASGDAGAASLRIDRELNSLLPASARATVKQFSADYERLVRVVGFITTLFASLAIASLVLAATGLFAVLAYMVHQRMREFGVRVALGAQRADLVRLVLKDGAEMVLAGTGFGAIGVILGAGVGAQLAFVLYGVEPTDPLALIVAEVVLLVVAFGACLVPALRATRADPVDTLRAT